MPASKRTKFGTRKEETQSYKTHIAIFKLFHFYLFNFSYKSDMLILRHSHVTAVFVNNDVQREEKIVIKSLHLSKG